MQRKPNQADQRPAEPLEADEATIAEAWQEQLAQAESNTRLAAALRQAPPALYGRFASAYRNLLAMSRGRRRKLLRSMGMTLAGAALAFALALGHVPIARAASISVGGSCTLVDAITAANTDTATGGCAAGSGADTITLSGNVTLTSVNNGSNGLPLITSAITIEGAGHTIARDTGSPNFRIFQVSSSGDLTLNDTTISGGSPGFNSGGGIYNFGTLMLNNSTVSGNTAILSGGGIVNFSGGTLMLNNSTVSGNTVSAVGGGIYNRGTLTLNGSTVSGNTGPDIGGGIENNGTLTLTNSTVSGNTAMVFGGGIYNDGTLTLTNSTVSGNSANYGGGGILNFATLTLQRSLVSGNSGSFGREIRNGATVVSANYNLFGHSGESNAQAFNGFAPSGSDISATSDGTTPTALTAILDTTLQNNGGDTETHALVTGSPALDAAPTGPATDQRGVSRPQGANFDIGAFELVVTPAEQIAQLTADVLALANSGTINGGQSNSLITKLEQTATQLAQEDPQQAISRLNAFINQVNGFISGGVLTSAEGQPLIDAANAIIHSLGG